MLRLDLAREFFEHKVLILHLGAELGGLEQTLAVPLEPALRPMSSGIAATSTAQPFVDEGQVVGREHDLLGVLDQTIVFGMEHVVDGGQADILVDAAVAGDEMRVEQFVVILGVAVAGIVQADRDVAVGDLADRHGVVRDVGEEGVAGTDAPPWRRLGRPNGVRSRSPSTHDVVGRIGNAIYADAGDQLREPVRHPE